MRFNPGLLCHRMEARYTVEAITVGESDRGHFDLGRAFGERIGLRSARKKAEGAGGV
jgi:hypothetical protein